MRRAPSPVPGSDEWVELRRSGLGATDAAVVAGRSRFAGPFDKYAEMLGQRPPIIETEPMRWGVILQGPVGKEWAARHGKRVRANGHTYWLEDGIFSHYDFDVVGEPSILEVKTASAYAQRDWGEQDTDQVPVEYLLQAQHEMMCRPGITRCYLAVLIGGQKLHSYVVEYDPELADYLLRIERSFLENTRAGIAPEIDGSNAATEYLRRISPADDGTVIDLPDDLATHAHFYLAAKAEQKLVEEKVATLGNIIRLKMADHSVAVGKEIKVTYKVSKDRAVTDWQKVALAAGATAEQIAENTTTQPGTRPLVVTWIGE